MNGRGRRKTETCKRPRTKLDYLRMDKTFIHSIHRCMREENVEKYTSIGRVDRSIDRRPSRVDWIEIGFEPNFSFLSAFQIANKEKIFFRLLFSVCLGGISESSSQTNKASMGTKTLEEETVFYSSSFSSCLLPFSHSLSCTNGRRAAQTPLLWAKKLKCLRF